MEKKQFQTESKKILDLMINSIYTHNEIFLRELISNASDAIDKIYYKSLSDGNIGMNRDDFFIKIYADKDARTLTVQDNGCGMSEEELEKNLGTIAHSGSSDFKKSIDSDDINIIGQFGVGFYSSFMVADKVTVKTKQYGSDVSYEWESSGTDGYTIEKSDYDNYGTQIILHIKENSDNYNYDEFLQDYKLESLIKKYSDYIRYPIILKKTVSKPKKTKKMNLKT
jgi:molecular chaperone HtpG